MSITAKELAKKLNISATAVSMALNNKPGVSNETRQMIIAEAEKYGYDFTKHHAKKEGHGRIYFITYASHISLPAYPPIEAEVSEGIRQICSENGFYFQSVHIYGEPEKLQELLGDLRVTGCMGIILSLVEKNEEICKQFLDLKIPVVLMNSYYDTLNCSSVMINNIQGASMATDYIIYRYQCHPGHLQISTPYVNLAERKTGFELSLKRNSLPVANTVTHVLSPGMENAFVDMLSVIDSKPDFARAYFADNDAIAIGAIKALKLRGYRVPEDIAIIGFDNIREGRVVDPSLTTVSVPWCYMGRMAMNLLMNILRDPVPHTLKLEISASLIKRFSA